MSQSENSRRDDRFDEVLLEYMRRRDCVEEVDREEFIAAHPDVADELRAYFADSDAVEEVVRPAARANDASSREEAEAVPLDVIRYFGDYELLEEIGRGGMGVVYRARQRSLNRIVAVKMILAGRLARQEDVDRFRREAEAAAQLKHPNIVTIFEVGEHEGQHYFSMDFVAGRSLGEIVREGPLSSRLAATYVKKIADAVEYAHQQGTLHRDLKPANVLIADNDEPIVTDFGLAKRVESDPGLTASGARLGSPSYMSPEQAAGRNEDVGPASDIYSLGATLYELLAGRPPFRADSTAATLLQVLGSEPVTPRLLNPTVDRELDTICLKCLEKDPARRYGAASALADDLSRWLDGRAIQARPVGRVEKTWRWCRRNPVVATLGIGTTLLVVLLAIAGPLVAIYQAELREQAEVARGKAQASRTLAQAEEQ